MTQHKDEWKQYKKSLEQVCDIGGIGYCPGCGITPEALEDLLASQKKVLVEKLERGREPGRTEYEVGFNKALDTAIALIQE